MGLNWVPCVFGKIPKGNVIEQPHRRLIVWEATAKCNFKCAHCYYTRQLNKQFNELSTDEILAALKGAALIGFNGLQLLGGEPLLRSDMFYIFERAKEFGFNYFQINSNGSLLDDEKAKKLTEFDVLVLISIDGPKAINDSVRGAGSFEKALSAIKLMAEYDGRIESYTVVTDDVAALSVEEIEGFLGTLSNAGVSCANFGKLTTEHLTSIETLLPSREQLIRFATVLLKNKTKWEKKFKIQIFLDEGIPFPLYWKNFISGKDFPEEYSSLYTSKPINCTIIGCTVGRGNVIIDPEGNVLDCVFLRRSFGNIRAESFENIFGKLLSAYTLPYQRCVSCRYQSLCGGACRLLEMHHLLAREQIEISNGKVAEYVGRLTSC